MAAREPKSKTITSIEIVGRPGGRKGRLELTTGNVIYFRQNAQSETLRLTYQQLLSLLEREIEYQSLDTNTKRFKFPKPHKNGDFRLYVNQIDETEELRFPIESILSLNKLDPRCVDGGDYQFRNSMSSGRKTKWTMRYDWIANVSIQAALWIINRYVDKFLVGKKMTDHEDEDIVVSKKKMREVLLMLFKKVDY
jgi:hypothetical protein